MIDWRMARKGAGAALLILAALVILAPMVAVAGLLPVLKVLAWAVGATAVVAYGLWLLLND